MRRLLTGARKRMLRRATIIAMIVLIPLAYSSHMRGHRATARAPPRGKRERRAGTDCSGGTVNAGEVIFKPDSDHDGMSDDDETKNDNPADTNTDNDGDGLTNGDEARLGYDPRNPASTPPPNASVVAIQVAPNQFTLTTNVIIGPQVVQLKVVTPSSPQARPASRSLTPPTRPRHTSSAHSTKVRTSSAC